MNRFVAVFVALCISLCTVVEANAKGALRTLTGIYVGAKTLREGYALRVLHLRP